MLQRKQLLIVSFPRNSDVYFYANPCPHQPLPLDGCHLGLIIETAHICWPLTTSQALCWGLHVYEPMLASKQPFGALMRGLRLWLVLTGHLTLEAMPGTPLLYLDQAQRSYPGDSECKLRLWYLTTYLKKRKEKLVYLLGEKTWKNFSREIQRPKGMGKLFNLIHN